MMADEQINGRCKVCGKIISDEEIIAIYESKGENRGNEEIVTGYDCVDCGHEERY